MLDEDTYKQAVARIVEAIKAKTNKSKYKLFTGLQQKGEFFATWWTPVQEQADKCNFVGYDAKMATRHTVKQAKAS